MPRFWQILIFFRSPFLLVPAHVSLRLHRMIQGLTTKGLLAFVVCASMVLCAVSPSAQAQAVYPLKVSPNQRYLVDQNSNPFMIVGDSPQGLITDLSISDA